MVNFIPDRQPLAFQTRRNELQFRAPLERELGFVAPPTYGVWGAGSIQAIGAPSGDWSCRAVEHPLSLGCVVLMFSTSNLRSSTCKVHDFSCHVCHGHTAASGSHRARCGWRPSPRERGTRIRSNLGAAHSHAFRPNELQLGGRKANPFGTRQTGHEPTALSFGMLARWCASRHLNAFLHIQI